MSTLCLTTTEIQDLFTEEVESRSGRVTDSLNDGRRIFTRSVLPQLDDVKRNDQVQGGVALKATPEEICVYPYVFREVCRNGAIMSHALQSQRLVLSEDAPTTEAKRQVSEAIAACCRPEAFAQSVSEIRSSVGSDVNLALNLLPWLSRMSTHLPDDFVSRILERFFSDGDSSRFGLMNAVTSVARDTTDPDVRWRLEELGGGIAARLQPRQPANSPGMQLAHR